MNTPIKIIIAGSRTFNDYESLKKTCDKIINRFYKKDIEIVSGCARGADKLGEDYAKERGYKIHYFPADWNKYSKKAGHIRNRKMAKFSDSAIIFWDGKSTGTKNMIKEAKKNNLKLIAINY